jgi:hypothetical protein
MVAIPAYVCSFIFDNEFRERVLKRLQGKLNFKKGDKK